MTTPIASYASAVAAYAKAAKGAAAGESAAGSLVNAEAAAGSFSGMVEDALRHSLAVAKEGERASLQAIGGRADIGQVVTAVAEAEVTLQTVIAIRDKIVQAYQEIARMPI
jgi:flagellar hook-basal body complex protein FliE